MSNNDFYFVLLSPKTPLVGERWDYQYQQVFKIHCIFSNVQITCNHDHIAVQEFVRIADDRVKRASMSCVELMI